MQYVEQMMTDHRWCSHNNLLRILIRIPKHSIPVLTLPHHFTSFLLLQQHKFEHNDHVRKKIHAQFAYYFIRLCSIYCLPILSAWSTPIYCPTTHPYYTKLQTHAGGKDLILDFAYLFSSLVHINLCNTTRSILCRSL